MKQFSRIFKILLLLSMYSNVQAQVGLKLGSNIGSKTANAVLDLGTGIKGLLLPKVALTSKTLSSPLVGANFAAAAPAGMIVYNTATANDVTPGIYYSDDTQWNRNEEIGGTNGLSKTGNLVGLGGNLVQATSINQRGHDLVFRPDTKSEMRIAQGNNITTTTANSRIYVPRDGIEIQSNEDADLTKPIVLFLNNLSEKVRIQSNGLVGIGTSSPTSTLHTTGTVAVTTGNTTENSVILATSNITLPTASASSGRIYIIRNINASAAITISSVINYNATTAAIFSLTVTQGAITVISNGTSWYRIQ